MFLGHALLAFALAAALARWWGLAADRALAVGLFAGAFAMVPDVDVLYAPVGIAGASSVLGAAEGFWAASTVVHRAVTHSVLLGMVAAGAAGLWSRGAPPARLAAAGGGGLLVAVAALDGWLAAAVTAAFVVAVLALAAIARRQGLRPRIVAGVALVGLVTHPFGDLFTGQPPALLYPLEATVVSGRVVLHPDPTLHLLGALGLELATAWLALAVLLRLRGHQFDRHLTPRAAVGLAYGSVAFVIPPPTLEASYFFVFPLLALALACAIGARPATWRDLLARRQEPWLAATTTGLAAITLAAGAYAAVYPWL